MVMRTYLDPPSNHKTIIVVAVIGTDCAGLESCKSMVRVEGSGLSGHQAGVIQEGAHSGIVHLSLTNGVFTVQGDCANFLTSSIGPAAEQEMNVQWSGVT